MNSEPDDDAMRAKRYRRHKGGDHSLCSPARCRHATVGPVTVAVDLTASAAVAELVESLRFAPDDPRAAMAVIAGRLAAAFDAEPSPSVARELRTAIKWMSELPGQPADAIDELRARRLARTAEGVLEAFPPR